MSAPNVSMETPAPADRGTLVRIAPWCLVLYAVLIYVLSVAHVSVVWVAIAATLVTQPLLVALIMTASAGLVARDLPRWGELAQLLGGAAVWALLSYGCGHKPPQYVTTLATVSMLVAAIGLARVLATWVLREKNLLPICLVLMGVIDIWGVTVGFTARALQHNPDAVAKASAALPALQTTAPMALALPDLSIGPGDVMFAALIFAVAARHGLGLRRNLCWMYPLFLAGLALAAFTSLPIPGLVFIGLSGLLANHGRWDYTDEERRNLKIVSALLVPLLLIAGLALHSRPAPTSLHDAPIQPGKPDPDHSTAPGRTAVPDIIKPDGKTDGK